MNRQDTLKSIDLPKEYVNLSFGCLTTFFSHRKAYEQSFFNSLNIFIFNNYYCQRETLEIYF